MEKLSMSIKTKLSIAVLVISMLCSLAIGVLSFLVYKHSMENNMGRQAMDIAQTVSANIDGDNIVQYDKTGKENEAYQDMLDYLCRVKKEVNLTYLYILVDADSEYKYIAEAYADISEEPCSLGDVESKDNYTSEPQETLSSGAANYTAVYRNALYGDLISGFAPIFDHQDNVVGIVGLDLGADIIYQNTNGFLLILSGIMALSCAVSFILINNITRKIIIKPVKALESASFKLSAGEFDVDIPEEYLKKADEIGHLSYAFFEVQKNLRNITSDISSVLNEMANKNLSIVITREYSGDYLPIRESINHIITIYHSLLKHFQDLTQQASANSKHVADIAQTLAQGSIEQSSTIEELSVSISGVAEEAGKNIEQVGLANNYVHETNANLNNCNSERQNMLMAMEEIQSSSKAISNIIQTMEDIAFQTNILALNAAVEAARAGVEGKGFAVVAEEVRSLAAKSAEAASQSSVLIREAINAVEKGKNIAETTAAALQTVSAKTQSVNDIFSVITKNSNEQATAITGIIEGMNQISIVAQANATTAEESSAISEELFDHTEQLKNEIKQFKL